jgi:hypothetical protein
VVLLTLTACHSGPTYRPTEFRDTKCYFVCYCNCFYRTQSS